MKTILKLARFFCELKEDIQSIKEQNTEIAMIRDSEMLTPKRAAIYMGVSERTIKDLVYQKEISCYRPSSNRLFIKKSSLDEYMQRNEIYSKYVLEKIATRHNKKT